MGGRGMWWEPIKQPAPFMDCPERAKENTLRQRNVMRTKERHRMKTRRLCFDAPLPCFARLFGQGRKIAPAPLASLKHVVQCGGENLT
ncbi:hypothetical protein FORC54_p015 (plasmid) [Vibrio vulnificus]|nr:hypothetical protein FORC54_p015 [Vibrio vulnificus]